MTFTYVAVRAYGDCLISLSLLHGARPTVSVNVAGTPLATRIAQLMGYGRFPITEILEDVAAFQDIRARGPVRGISDLIRARRRIRDLLRDGGALVFEHRDWRNRLLVPRGRRYHQPEYGVSIYEDRHALLGTLLGGLPPLEPCRPLTRTARRWVVNPGARQRFKALPTAVVRNVLACAAARGVEVTLLDPAREHAALAREASLYVPSPPLERALALLREGDAYIGGDSFFLHLAYALRMPLFAIPPGAAPHRVPPRFLEYFYPPGLLPSGSFLRLPEAMDTDRLRAAMDAASR